MVAVDTSVLLTIFKQEPLHVEWTKALVGAAQVDKIVVCPIIVAEVRAYFDTDVDCLFALSSLKIELSDISEDSALLAGQVFKSYRQQGGPRTTILPDFMVAAHAVKQATALATRDRGFLRQYFPTIRLLVP